MLQIECSWLTPSATFLLRRKQMFCAKMRTQVKEGIDLIHEINLRLCCYKLYFINTPYYSIILKHFIYCTDLRYYNCYYITTKNLLNTCYTLLRVRLNNMLQWMKIQHNNVSRKRLAQFWDYLEIIYLIYFCI